MVTMLLLKDVYNPFLPFEAIFKVCYLDILCTLYVY